MANLGVTEEGNMLKRLKRILVVLGLFVVFTASSAMASTFDIDSGHSTIGFAVKHLQVGTTRGRFNDYSGTINLDTNDFSTFSADIVIQTASIDTNLEARDKHLKSPDFLDATGHPTITFNNARLERRGAGKVIVGDLTIRGITKLITIPVTISDPVQSPFGATVIGIIGQTTINRQDFGVSWSKQLDTGGLVVDDFVTLIIEIEAQKKS